MPEKRLLICDDEPAFGRFVKNVAEEFGYVVRVTTDGDEFIEAYDSFAPTTIVLDMIMPGMDGNELVLWLAKRKCTARVIIITGYTPDYATHAKILAEFKGLGPVTTCTNRSKSADCEPSWDRDKPPDAGAKTKGGGSAARGRVWATTNALLCSF